MESHVPWDCSKGRLWLPLDNSKIPIKLIGICWCCLWLNVWSLPCTLLDWQRHQARKVARLGVVVPVGLAPTREGEGSLAWAFHRSHYVNRIWLPSSTGASAPLTVPRAPILFCPRQWSWVMDWAEPANAWCNCQRDLIISTLHVGLLCSAVSSSLSGNFEPARIRGGGVLQKVTGDAFAFPLPV